METTKKWMKPRELALLGLLTALLLVLYFTPLGYLNIGPLAMTMNMIPVAIGAIALGVPGGAILGGVFGVTSVLQAMGVGGTSLMGAATFAFSPFLTIVQRFGTRVLVGICAALIYKLFKRITNHTVACFVTGFSAAFLNTVFFMGTLVLMFSKTDFVRDAMGAQNPVLWICTYVGVQALFEMALSTVITGAVGVALEKAHLLKEKRQ